MIEQLLIQNFQAHAKLRVEFAATITTVVGASDVGKSAIIRALRWVCTNQPQGDAFVRHGTKGCTVKLLVDGHTITRKRGKGDVNTYAIDEQEFKAFGRGVPEPVVELLNLGDVCWQRQHDAPYWFSETAGEVSRQLNAIVDLGIIDDTLSAVATAFNKARARLEGAEDALTEAKAGAERLVWVDDFDSGLAVVEAAHTKAIAVRDKATLAAKLAEGVLRHKNAHDVAAEAAGAAQGVVDAGTRAVKARNKAAVVDSLVRVVAGCVKEANRTIPSTKPMEDAMARHKEARKSARSLQMLILNLETQEAAVDRAKKHLWDAEAALPKVCPTCGGKV